MSVANNDSENTDWEEVATFIGMTKNYSVPSVVYGPVSPVTLHQEWSLAILGIMGLLSFNGCLMAGCVITSIFVQRKLCRLGNSFLGTVAFCDIIDCLFFMPASMVVIISNKGNDFYTCQLQLFISRMGTSYKYLIFMFVSLDDFWRLRTRPGQYISYHSRRSVMFKIFVCIIISTVYSILSTFGTWGPAYCDRRLHGDKIFQYSTFVIMFALPTVFNAFFQIRTSIAAKKHFVTPKMRRPPIMNREWNLAIINIGNFCTLVLTTAPALIVQAFDLQVSDGTFYTLSWLTFIFRSSIINVVYGISNVEFKRGFAFAIKYFCLKSTVMHTGRQSYCNRREMIVRFHVLQPTRLNAEREERVTAMRGNELRAL